MLINEYPESERPINRVCEVGTKAVSTLELIASILQTKDAMNHAQQLFALFGSITGIAKAEIEELAQVKGISKAQAARLKAAFELGCRFLTEGPDELYQIGNPAQAAQLLYSTIGHETQEHFMVLYLDTRHKVTKQVLLYKGTANTSIVRIPEIFKGAMLHNAVSIIVAHNHPSGDPNPSPEDVALTRRIVAAGKMVEIELLDHLIIGGNRHCSLRERGLGFSEA